MKKPEKDNQVPGRALLFFMMLTGLAFFSIAEAQQSQTVRIIITFQAEYTSKIEKNPEEYIHQLKTLTRHEELIREMSFPQSWVISIKAETHESIPQLINLLESAYYVRVAEPDYSMSH